jgi:hypothetical protein
MNIFICFNLVYHRIDSAIDHLSTRTNHRPTKEEFTKIAAEHAAKDRVYRTRYYDFGYEIEDWVTYVLKS